MTIKVDWVYMTQTKLRCPLRIWFEKRKITTYEQAEKALREVGLSVGTREEVAPHLPSPPDKTPASNHSSTSPVSSTVRSNKKVQRKSRKSTPRSAAEVAADAITESSPVKSPKEAPVRKRRKRKGT